MAGDPRVLGLLENQKANNMAVNTLGNTFSNFQGSNMPMPGVFSPMTPNVQGKLKVDEEGIYGAKGSLQVPVNKNKTIAVGGNADVNFPFTAEGQDPFGGNFTYQNPGTVQAGVNIGRTAPKGLNWNLGIDYQQGGRQGSGLGATAGFSNTF